jgi:transcriptional regulator with XRE-family HTH domain
MPAPRLERRENPLLKLRSILGNGPKPMHQLDFAQLTGISAATLRAIEAGRRVLTRENCLERIEYLLGATFDNHEWRYMRTRDLYSFRHYTAFTDARAKDPDLKAKCLRALIVRALELFKAVPARQWFQLFWWMMLKLKEAASEFGIKGSANILAQTEPLWRFHPAVQGVDGKRLPKIAIDFDPSIYRNDDALLDFRKWSKF